MKLTIGITTFKYRFEKYFKPLLAQIHEYEPDLEIIVAINGEHKEKFDSNYRKDILTTIANYDQVYPIMFTEFRGLSKLWNSIIINTSGDYILMLNDDIAINSAGFLHNIKLLIEEHQTSFKINNSWSHVVLKKQEVMDVGFFDERLLGIGEEDGFFEWKYFDTYKKNFQQAYVLGVINYVDMSHNPTNTKVIKQGKYSLLNNKIMYETIFTIDEIYGVQHGICPAKLILNETHEQYPYEKFYLENRDKL